MRAKLGLAGLLAALALAGLPGVSSAGWCGALTVGLRPPSEAPHATKAPEADKASGDAVFKLACRSCHRGSSNYYSGYGAYYSGYGSYYPSYSYYAGYGSYYPSYSYSGYGNYSSGYGNYTSGYGSYYSGYGAYYSAYPVGCGGWSPCGCDSGW